jgi:hypothetical protein
MKTKFTLFFCLCFASFQLQSQIFDWAFALGGDVQDEGRAVATDNSGNIYTAGLFRYITDFDPEDGVFELTANGGGSDVFIQKSDANGHFVWAIQFGSENFDEVHGLAIDAAGDILVVGHFNGTADFDPDSTNEYNLTSAGGDDVYVAKFHNDGALVWAKNMGGLTTDEGHAVAVDSDNNVIIGGRFQGIADFDPGNQTFNLTATGGSDDFFICKLNATGNFIWALGTGANSNDHCIGVTTDNSGNVIATGYYYGVTDFDPGAGENLLTAIGAIDIFIAKYDAAGLPLWVNSFGSVGWDAGYAVQTDAAGNIYATGRFENTVDFDSGSGMNEITTVGEQDIYLLKLNADGSTAWANGFGSTSPEWGQSIDLDNNSNIYLTGFYQSTIDFNPGAAQNNLTSAGGEDVFICKYDLNGNHIWSQTVGGTDASFGDRGQSIAVDNSGNVYTTGWFYGTADLNPEADVLSINSHGNFDAFLIKTHPIPADVESDHMHHFIQIYPNPTSDFVQIIFDQTIPNAHIEIFNATGQMIETQNLLSTKTAIIPLSGPKGIYFIRLKDHAGIETKFKVIKE